MALDYLSMTMGHLISDIGCKISLVGTERCLILMGTSIRETGEIVSLMAQASISSRMAISLRALGTTDRKKEEVFST